MFFVCLFVLTAKYLQINITITSKQPYSKNLVYNKENQILGKKKKKVNKALMGIKWLKLMFLHIQQNCAKPQKVHFFFFKS